MVECYRCKQEKTAERFPPDPRKKNGLGSWCRDCRVEYNRERGRTEGGIAKRRAAQLAQRKMKQARMLAFLKGSSCADCDLSDFRVLEFDHVGGKTANVARLLGATATWKRVEEEMARCEVVCRNCHRRRTYTRKPNYRVVGWFQHQAPDDLRVAPEGPEPSPFVPRRKKAKGVCWHKTQQRWMAYGRESGKTVYLGYFDTEEAALSARGVWEIGHGS